MPAMANDQPTIQETAYQEHVEVIAYPNWPGEKTETCRVSADKDGWFIIVETDPYEGCAHMALPLAEKVHEALGRAISAAQVRQKEIAIGR